MKLTESQLKRLIKEWGDDEWPDPTTELENEKTMGSAGPETIEHAMNIEHAVQDAMNDPAVINLHQIAYTLEDELWDVYEEIKKRGIHPAAKLARLIGGRGFE